MPENTGVRSNATTAPAVVAWGANTIAGRGAGGASTATLNHCEFDPPALVAVTVTSAKPAETPLIDITEPATDTVATAVSDEVAALGIHHPRKPPGHLHIDRSRRVAPSRRSTGPPAPDALTCADTETAGTTPNSPTSTTTATTRPSARTITRPPDSDDGQPRQ